MSYTNPNLEGRLIIISLARDAFADLYTREIPGAVCSMLEGGASEVVYKVNEGGAEDTHDLYHVPFLLHPNGEPWHEANSYLLWCMRDKSPLERRTDEVRRRGSKLLDYLLFCETNNLDWLDFSGSRPPLRPTYKYFNNLVIAGKRSGGVINQYTSVVYHFYKYVSQYWHPLDIRRVDTVKQVKFLVQTPRGAQVIDVMKRSQTRRTPSSNAIQIGFVRDGGDDLRPLTNIELRLLLETINGGGFWSTVERLILLTSLMTGARKQTVLTMRLKHLKAFEETRLLSEGAYKLHAGPSTGIDTKNDKAQTLYFPKQLAEELIVLASSPAMKKRQSIFLNELRVLFPDQSFEEDDVYLFLSDQCNSYYMEKSDPRYFMTKSPQTGQVTETIKRKLLKSITSGFPSDFSYHWLRATFAYQLYQRLQVLIREGLMHVGDDIDFIQKRMHHESRQTTEGYLKLFKMTHEKICAQELWEKKLFNGSYDVLIVDSRHV
ncbi:site-specific integrase [Pseudomonas sp. O39]|uniref:site-specific integrase n=1 Tax=Pseudomonas sp. O39 TaxID=3379130 RepID=UPI00387AEA8E